MPEIIICGMSDRMSQVKTTHHRDLRKDLIHVLGRVLPRPNSRNEAAVLAHIIRRFVGIEDDGNVEEAEENDQDDKGQVVQRLRAANGAEHAN